MKKDSFADAIETNLENVDSNIDISNPAVEDSIVAVIDIVVDGKDAAIDKTKSTNDLSNELEGFTVLNSDGIF